MGFFLFQKDELLMVEFQGQKVVIFYGMKMIPQESYKIKKYPATNRLLGGRNRTRLPVIEVG